MPYRTLDDRIDGVVITFADITVAKTLEAQLREKHAVLEKHVAKQSGNDASGEPEEGKGEQQAVTSHQKSVNHEPKAEHLRRSPPDCAAAPKPALRDQRKVCGQRPKISPEGSESKSDADTRRLLHELQVHQVELEMQNAELQKARDEMEVMLEKYTDLYDFAPVGYLSLDELGPDPGGEPDGRRLAGRGTVPAHQPAPGAFCRPGEPAGFSDLS